MQQKTGKKPILYTGSYFWDGNKLGSKHAGYPLWTAHYTSAACPLVPDPWTQWTFWQYTSSASVAGVTGNVDANRFNGTLAQLKAFIAQSVVSPPPPLVPPDTGVSPGQPDASTPPPPPPPAADAGASGEASPGGEDGGLLPGVDGLLRLRPGADLDTLQGGCATAGARTPASAPLLTWGVMLLLALGLSRRAR